MPFLIALPAVAAQSQPSQCLSALSVTVYKSID